MAAFRIREDDTLDPINTQPSEGTGPCHVSLDATGSCLMVANYGSGSVASLRIDEDGSLVKSNSAHQHEGSSINERRQKGPHAHSIYAGPDNKFAYAPDLGIDQVVIYSLNPESAKALGVTGAETLELVIGSERHALPVRIDPSLPERTVGVPVGLEGLQGLRLPAEVTP